MIQFEGMPIDDDRRQQKSKSRTITRENEEEAKDTEDQDKEATHSVGKTQDACCAECVPD